MGAQSKGKHSGLVWLVWSLLIGFIAGVLVQATFDPFIKKYIPWIKMPGSLAISVRFKDGKLVAGSELSDLILFRNGGKWEVYDKIDPEQATYWWRSLPPGEYSVEAYINDMFAGGTNWVKIGPGEARELTITAYSQNKLKVRIYYKVEDRITPMEGARVEVRSHKGFIWRSAITDSKGETIWFYLQPTGIVNPEKGEHYRIDVYFKDNFLDSKRIELKAEEPMVVEIFISKRLQD